jgi:hypothetical protein
MLHHITPPARLIAAIERRKTFPLLRANEANRRCRANGGNAMDAACASIEAGFDEACLVNSLKLSVLRAIKLGTGHPLIRAEYGEYARRIRETCSTIDDAIILTELQYREVALRKDNRRSLQKLKEIRLLLRLLRRSNFRNNFTGVLDFLLSDPDYDRAVEHVRLVMAAE